MVKRLYFLFFRQGTDDKSPFFRYNRLKYQLPVRNTGQPALTMPSAKGL